MTQLPAPTNLREAILLSLAYLDAIGIAPTPYEVWRLLPRWTASIGEVYQALYNDPLLKSVTHHERGHLSLRSSEHIQERLERGKISEFKWRRARSTAAALTLIPFLTSVSVANTVATGTARHESDIDLFITVKPGRMWTTRLLTTAVVFLLGRFRRKQHVADRICLSFYVTDDALNFSQLALEGDDPYLAHWIASLGTMLDLQERTPLGEKLFAANPWIRQLMPNLAPQTPSERRRVPTWAKKIARPVGAIGEWLLSQKMGDQLEQRLRSRQLRRMNKVAPTELKTPTQHIVISDKILKFHEQDRREWFKQRTIATFLRLQAGELPELSSEQPELSAAGLVMQPVGATVGATVTTVS